MTFFEMLKSSILKILNEMRFTEVFIGEVIDGKNLKIKINEKLILTENEIVRPTSFYQDLEEKTKLLILRQQGGQIYYILNTIYIPEEEKEGNDAS